MNGRAGGAVVADAALFSGGVVNPGERLTAEIGEDPDGLVFYNKDIREP